MNSSRIALVTGGNRGLGFEISRQLGQKGITVVIGARDKAKGESSAEALRAEGLDVYSVALHVTERSTIKALPAFFEEKFGRLDILVNNAGIFLDLGTQPSELDTAQLRQTFETNFFGAFEVTRALLPLIKKSEAGRIVNMSSVLGSLAAICNPDASSAWVVAPAYQASKAALNTLTALFAKELRGTKVKVNSACPGWCKTDMGTSNAPLTVEQGADTPVWLATLSDDGPNGHFFNSRQEIPW